MEIKKIALTPPYERFDINGSGLKPVLTAMIHDSQPERKFPAIIIAPGGCYSRCSKREGEPTAARFYSYGYNAFVLEYSVKNKPFPIALCEIAEATAYIRRNINSLRCEDRIFICGFSAGGHLSASLGVYYPEISEKFGGENIIRPDGLILCYPVITAGEFTHSESCSNIAPTEALRDKISLENHITGRFPKSFIWHCADDRTVSVMNSLMLAEKLSANNVPFELHIFPQGGHGIALCDITTVKDNNPRYINPCAAQWMPLALQWLRSL